MGGSNSAKEELNALLLEIKQLDLSILRAEMKIDQVTRNWPRISREDILFMELKELGSIFPSAKKLILKISGRLQNCDYSLADDEDIKILAEPLDDAEILPNSNQQDENSNLDLDFDLGLFESTSNEKCSPNRKQNSLSNKRNKIKRAYLTPKIDSSYSSSNTKEGNSEDPEIVLTRLSKDDLQKWKVDSKASSSNAIRRPGPKSKTQPVSTNVSAPQVEEEESSDYDEMVYNVEDNSSDPDFEVNPSGKGKKGKTSVENITEENKPGCIPKKSKRRVPCPQEGCPMTFPQNYNAKRHFLRLHGTKKSESYSNQSASMTIENDPNKPGPIKEKSKRRFPCPQEGCPRMFPQSFNARRHYLRAHADESKSKSVPVKNSNSKEEHLVKNSKKETDDTVITYTCDLCGKTLSSLTGLKTHRGLMHPTESGIRKDLICPVNNCGKSFTVSNNLRRHFVSVHNNYRPFNCPHCSLHFKRGSHLKKHLNSHKNKEEITDSNNSMEEEEEEEQEIDQVEVEFEVDQNVDFEITSDAFDEDDSQLTLKIID